MIVCAGHGHLGQGSGGVKICPGPDIVSGFGPGGGGACGRLEDTFVHKRFVYNKECVHMFYVGRFNIILKSPMKYKVTWKPLKWASLEEC